MKRSNRLRWLGAIALGVIVLLTLIAAPGTSQLNSGSTYSRAPDGYGAWYAFMEQRKTPVKRLLKPFSSLVAERNVTLLRVNSQVNAPELDRQEQDWVEKGNTLAILGVSGQVTDAKFSTIQTAPDVSVKIDTRRRRRLKDAERKQLGDFFGAVVWEKRLGKGKVIFSITPHLAANAYQDRTGNYAFLARIVSENSNAVFVDEYIHGYKDKSVRESENEQDWLTYLAQTPLFPALLQGGILLLVLIWAQNRRFGPPQPLEAPVVDNSEAYIQALAGVLQKAESREFVLEMVGKEEQLQLQKALGLGQVSLNHQTLVDAWVQQTGSSGAELEQLLRLQSQKRRISETELLMWLKRWQAIRSQVPIYSNPK